MFPFTEPNLMGIDKSTGAPESLHYILCQEPHIDKIHTEIEETVAWMQPCVELGRSIRTRKDLLLKAPLREAVVIHPDPKVHKQILSMQSYIVDVRTEGIANCQWNLLPFLNYADFFFRKHFRN
ncbi:hypothetical protein AAHC03_024351 [Spirometra sp. Aus1]